MKHGDISNRISPRWLFQFERLIANPPKVAKLVVGGRRFGRWKRVFDTWETQPYTIKLLWDLYWRHDARFDVVTFLRGINDDPLPDGAISAIHNYLEDRALPFGRVIATTPDKLGRDLAVMPDVVRVVHSEEGSTFKFGAKGLYVPAETEGWSAWT